MRRAGDRQPDVNLKRSWLRSLPEKERPGVIYDDRKRVVDMWRAEVCLLPGGAGGFRLSFEGREPLHWISMPPRSTNRSALVELTIAVGECEDIVG
jgi:hypothetical protein